MQEKMPDEIVNGSDEREKILDKLVEQAQESGAYKLPYGKKHKKRRMRKVRRNKV